MANSQEASQLDGLADSSNSAAKSTSPAKYFSLANIMQNIESMESFVKNQLGQNEGLALVFEQYNSINFEYKFTCQEYSKFSDV